MLSGAVHLRHNGEAGGTGGQDDSSLTNSLKLANMDPMGLMWASYKYRYYKILTITAFGKIITIVGKAVDCIEMARP